MKKLMMTMAAAALATAALAEMSLADARGKIGEAVNDAAKMAEIIAQLNPSNQVAFLSDVNAAIERMPGSNEEKAARFLDANEAALRNAEKGNLQTLLAEVFATVPPEALTVLNERMAADLFNRAADPSNPISDAEFVDRATSTMSVIESRAAQTDDAAVRDTFAILMFLRASNGSPADLADTLIKGLPDESSRDLAKSEWIPSAMGDGVAKSYDPLLGASDAGTAPDIRVVIDLATPAEMEALLSNLGTRDNPYTDAILSIGNLGLPGGGYDMSGLDRVPRTTEKTAPWHGGGRRGEPRGYAYQNL